MRLFIALPLSNEIKAALAGISGGIAGTRWVEPESMHITLKFIGEVGRGEADDLHTELAAIRFPEFEVSLQGIGTFERRGHIRMLWAGLDDGHTVSALRDRVEAAAIRAGFQPEPRKYKPHVTLSRFKSHAMPEIGPYLEMHNAFSTPSFTVDHFNLYQSRLGRSGARYEVLNEYPLQQMVYYGDDAVAFAD